MSKKEDKLENYIKYYMSAIEKVALIIFLFFLWLKFSTDLFAMFIFFGISIVISIILTIYELIFYKNIYKK